MTTRSSNPSAVAPKYVRARSSAMTRLSPPSPAGKEWLTTPTIVKYTTPFWVCNRELRADRPARWQRRARPARGSSGRPRARSARLPGRRRRHRGRRATRRRRGRSRRRPRRRRRRSPTGSGAASPAATPGLLLIAASTWSFWVTGLVTSTLPGEEVGDPAVTRGERSGAQRADADGGRHRDGEPGGGHRGPVPGPGEMSGAGLRAADEAARWPGR